MKKFDFIQVLASIIVLAFLGIIMYLFKLLNTPTDNDTVFEVLKTLITTFAASFTTIIGFYFGQRSAERAADMEARRQQLLRNE